MFEDLKIDNKARMEKAVNALGEELKKVRSGRAHISMLDSIRINYYGTLSPLNQVASISCPDSKSFLIAPWETPMLKEIETAIVKTNLGMTPMNDGKTIRLKLPDLTEERRRNLVKMTKKCVEDARVAIRMARRDANETLKKALKEKGLSEDEHKKHTTEIQKLTDNFIGTVEKIATEKEKDIMTI